MFFPRWAARAVVSVSAAALAVTGVGASTASAADPSGSGPFAAPTTFTLEVAPSDGVLDSTSQSVELHVRWSKVPNPSQWATRGYVMVADLSRPGKQDVCGSYFPAESSDVGCTYPLASLLAGDLSSHTYVARLLTAQTGGVVMAETAPVTVRHRPWRVDLAGAVSSNAVTLSFTTNQPWLNSGWGVYIVDEVSHTLVRDGYRDTWATKTLPLPAGGSYRYTAYVGYHGYKALPAGQLLPNVIGAQSNPVQPDPGGPISPNEVSGGYNPSENCVELCQGDPVNTATGEFSTTNTDVDLPGSGPRISWVTGFTGSRSTSDGPLGYGWTGNWLMTVEGVDAALANAQRVRVVQENGSAVYFSKSDGRWSAPARVHATLADSGEGGFTLVRDHTEVFDFDSAGRLITERDLNGNTATLSYAIDGRLEGVTSSNGHSLSVEWSGSRIATVTGGTQRVEYSYSGSGELEAATKPGVGAHRYTYDATHRIASLTNALGKRTDLTYDSAGRVLTQSDSLGRTYQFKYDSGATTTTLPDGSVVRDAYQYGQAVSTTTALGTASELTTSFVYDQNNNVIKVTDTAGRTWLYERDADGNPTKTTDPMGHVSMSTYTPLGLPATMTDALGRVTAREYDERGNLIKETAPDGSTVTRSFTPTGQVKTSTNALGQTTSYEYDPAGLPAAVTSPSGARDEATYDSNGWTTTETDATGAVTLYGYTPSGYRQSVTDGLGHGTVTAHDAAGNVISTLDPEGRRTTSSYNANGELLAHAVGDDSPTTYIRDSMGRVAAVGGANGGTTTYEHSAAGRATKTIDPLGRVTTATYDPAGNKTSTTDAGGRTTSYTYDLNGEVTSVTDPSGRKTTYTYDAVGNMTQTTDPNYRVTSTTYDAANRVKSVTSPSGAVAAYQYDPAGRVASYVDADKTTWGYAYDPDGRLSSTRDSAGRVTGYTYDGASHLLTKIYPDGTHIDRTYNPDGTVSAVHHSDQTPSVTYTYDRSGLPLSMTDGQGVVTYTYDSAGRLAGTTRTHDGASASTVRYERDAAGQVTKITYPTGHDVSRVYDSVGELTKVTDWNGGVYAFTYDATGNVASTTFPNGVKTIRSADPVGNLTGISTKSSSGATVLNLAYTYTPSNSLASAVTQRPTATQSNTYTWNANDRLYTVSGPASGTVRQDASDTALVLPGTTTLAYDSTRVLTTATTSNNYGSTWATPSTTAFVYDTRGNRTSATTDGLTTKYTYDLEANLTSVTADGTHYEYGYDGTGLRVASSTTAGEGAPVTSLWSWDALSVVPELLTDGANEYVYGPSSTPLSQIGASSSRYLHGDLINSIRAVTGATGAVIAETDYTAYGAPTGGTNSTSTKPGVSAVTPFGFAGEHTDQTGLIYLRTRMYDPATGQFTTRDPLEPLTHQAYGYTPGNPLQYIDPLGATWWNPGSWTSQTWDNIAGATGGVAFVLDLTGVGAPLGVALQLGSAGAAVRASYMHHQEGDDVEAALSGAGALVGVVGLGMDGLLALSPALTGTRTALRAPRLVRDIVDVADRSSFLLDQGSFIAQGICLGVK